MRLAVWFAKGRSSLVSCIRTTTAAKPRFVDLRPNTNPASIKMPFFDEEPCVCIPLVAAEGRRRLTLPLTSHVRRTDSEPNVANGLARVVHALLGRSALALCRRAWPLGTRLAFVRHLKEAQREDL